MNDSRMFPFGAGKPQSRRSFFRTSAWLGLGAAFAGWLPKILRADDPAKPPKPKTNIADALKYPRTGNSMPGRFPGRVVEVYHPSSVVDRIPQEGPAYEMVKTGMLSLTGAATLSEAWRMFVNPKERVGLKVNPVAGKELTTSHEITKAVIRQLTDAGIPKSDIMIWDRRLFELHEVGFTQENYPGITIAGTEIKDEAGSFTGSDGKLYSEAMIDKGWYYWADVEGEYDSETLPYMVNGGKYSY